MNMNTVTNYSYDKKSNLGHITINGHHFPLWRHFIGYKEDLITPIKRYFVIVSNIHNMSNRFQIESAQIKGLISKIKRHPYKLVKGC